MLLYNKKVMGVLSPKNRVVVGKNGNGKFTLATKGGRQTKIISFLMMVGHGVLAARRRRLILSVREQI